MKNLIKETGLRDISALRKRYPKAEIYFHQDLDGVTTAIAMKKYLEDNGIDVVGVHVIQYGEKEFAVKKGDAKGNTMPVLVDFAHGKPMFVIHTDHHDKQIGAEKGASKSFRQARSNVETISQIISPKDLFPSPDVLLINTVDSADFARQDISPDEVVNYLFRFDKDKTLQRNKMLLGFVINKLLLAFKNRRGFLEQMVMNSEPSLMSILANIKSWMKETNAPKPEELQKHAQDYAKQMKGFPHVEDNIIFQYGGGSMVKPGSYDRYTPFRNNPEADFLIMAWPMGLLQVSCNPFKKNRELKGVNLGEIAQEVLAKYEAQLKERKVPLSSIKWISETGVNPESIGFTFQDFNAVYGEKFASQEKGEEALMKLEEMMSKPFTSLTEKEKEVLDNITVSAWDLIQANSGGHKCITNISGLNYLGRSKRPPEGTYKYNPEREDAPYIKFVKMLAGDFFRKLKEKISQSKEETKVTEQKILKPDLALTQPNLVPTQISTYVKKKDLILPSDNPLSLDEGYFMFFVFPKYRPTVEDSFLNRMLRKIGKDVEWVEDKLGLNEQTAKQGIKIYATGHGGCIIINKDGSVNLFEFGPYDEKGIGKVLQTSMGRIAKFDTKKSLINPDEVAKLCKAKTYRDGPKLDMLVSLLSLPNEKMAMSEAVKPRKYDFLDIVGGGDSNCATYAVDVANAGGIKDVQVGKTLDFGFGYGIPEKPTIVFKKFNKSRFFINSFQV
jgi:hypothetical protein